MINHGPILEDGRVCQYCVGSHRTPVCKRLWDLLAYKFGFGLPRQWILRTPHDVRIPFSQGAQYPLIKEYSLNHIRDPSTIEGIFLNLGSLG